MRPRFFLGSAALLAACLLGTLSSPAQGSDPRHGERRAYTPPPSAFFSRLEEPTATTSFSPLVDAIVSHYTVPVYDRFLRDLSGKNSVVIGGSSYTITTRYSYSTGGQKSWQYAYERLQSMGYAVHYQTYTRMGQSFKNIIATLPGQVTPKQVYVLCGHIDSTSENPSNTAPGAEDNGSGSSAVLAAAQVLANEHFESTIELVLFSGEEQGLWGSEAYVANEVAQGRDIRDAVNMDMISYVATHRGVVIEGGHSWAALMQVYADAITAYTDLTYQFTYISWGSDHVPFQDAGIPAFLAIDADWNDYPWYHSTGDTYERTNPSFAVEIAQAAVATVAHLAGPLGSSDVPPVAEELRLVAYPNPARSSLAFTGPALVKGLTLSIVDAAGRSVRTLDEANGWDLRDERGRPVEAGVYWARAGAVTRKIVVIR